MTDWSGRRSRVLDIRRNGTLKVWHVYRWPMAKWRMRVMFDRWTWGQCWEGTPWVKVWKGDKG